MPAASPGSVTVTATVSGKGAASARAAATITFTRSNILLPPNVTGGGGFGGAALPLSPQVAGLLPPATPMAAPGTVQLPDLFLGAIPPQTADPAVPSARAVLTSGSSPAGPAGDLPTPATAGWLALLTGMIGAAWGRLQYTRRRSQRRVMVPAVAGGRLRPTRGVMRARPRRHVPRRRAQRRR
ncbi:hypothetical protein [Actinomadura violacea]|uniref:Big-1 domain-containing protein n=1 Tax=Actinomadura violacea TaxID=2819934 RepID=A0ABS3RNB3_9ACTN|nr:hypothetical protein [Actinomadura violacea]MBO2457554.1 hypothetical protein [Actinomadura violacea]